MEVLKPGDCLLYGRTPIRVSVLGWFFGLVINIKTWSAYSHVEIYAGNGMSFASRDGVGVGLYPFRPEQLLRRRRPKVGYCHEKAVAWFSSVEGQRYDWKGLLCFTLAVAQGARDRMFCSEFATRFYRAGDLAVFSPETDADKVAPAQFAQTTELETLT